MVAANAAGFLWLILDGMVLDVTDWLSEHPGGKSIIPRQALNLDCARFFEVGIGGPQERRLGVEHPSFQHPS